jgi:ribosomal protein S6--L-glutamate ligase
MKFFNLPPLNYNYGEAGIFSCALFPKFAPALLQKYWFLVIRVILNRAVGAPAGWLELFINQNRIISESIKPTLQLISFDPLRVWDIPGVRHIKPELWSQEMEPIRAADWLLFPEYWQLGVLAYVLRKHIFPSLSSYYLGYSKAEMTYAFQAVCAEHTPYTRILPNTDSALEQILDEFTFPFVAKEVRNAEGRGVFLIENRRDLADYKGRNSMLYVQELLPIDRDIRVVVVGREVVTAYWRIAPPDGFHNNVARGGVISFDAVPDEVISLVQRVAAELDIDYAGFDVALVDDYPYLLEFNMRFGNDALRQQGIRLGPRILAYLQRQMSPVTI